MALLVVLLGMIAPVLSNSLRGRGLTEEATRLVALTEFARSEAVSQGLPTTVWYDPKEGRYGLEVKAGYENIARPDRARSYEVNPDLRLEITGKMPTNGNRVTAAEFAADGALAVESAENIRLTDRFGSAVLVARTADGGAFEIAKSAR